MSNIESIFPVIRTFDDLWAVVGGRPEFVVQDGPCGAKSIRYLFGDENTFSTPMAKECRGVVFGADNRIVARPFHKIFNINERPQTHETKIPWARILGALPKHDGTLVYFVPILDGRKVLWVPKTKNHWKSKQTRLAERVFFREPLIRKTLQLAGISATVLFEYVGPQNRIVVPYENEALLPCAVRDIVSGKYWDNDTLRELLRLAGWPGPSLPKMISVDWQTLKQEAQAETGISREGWILIQDDGERYKVKTLGYASTHKALSNLTPAGLLDAWCSETLDDLLAVLRGSGRLDKVVLAEKLSNRAADALKEAINSRAVSDPTQYMAYARKEIVPLLLRDGDTENLV